MAERRDRDMMRRAVAEARRSPAVESAYCVGAVLAGEGGEVVATGFSREMPGSTHAEQVAFARLDEAGGALVAGALTLYTTMEPCSRRASSPTSCTERTIARRDRVRRVVIGVLEPAHFVAECEGVRRLREAGIAVDVLRGMERECLLPNAHIPGVAAQIEALPR